MDYALSPFRSRAEGEVTSGGSNLSFDYSEKHSVHDVYLTCYMALKPHVIPLGLKLGMGRVTALKPRLDWTITENGTEVEADRQVWAWSTLQGGRLFDGYEGRERARTQDNYTVGSLYRFDIQAATTLPRLKFGGRFRYNWGKLDQYRWEGGGNDLTGSYGSTEAKRISETTFRVYGNKNWIKRDRFLFNTLVLSRYTVCDSTGVMAANNEVTSGREERAKTFVFQINPNINIYPWNNKFTFIDLAVLINYSHMRYDFTEPVWVGGGQKRSNVNTYVWDSEDYAWYDFSYGKQNFFEIAFDANPTFPVFGNKSQAVAVSLNVLFWTRFKWFYKYYGENQPTSTDANFVVQNTRKNFEREIWLNSNINIIYKRDPYMFRLMFGQPLTYSLSPRSRVYDASGKNLVTEVTHDNMWVSQSGAQIGLFVSTSLDNLFKRRKAAETTLP